MGFDVGRSHQAKAIEPANPAHGFAIALSRRGGPLRAIRAASGIRMERSNQEEQWTPTV
jgi:hypothetical protein